MLMWESETYNLTEITKFAHGIGPKWSVIFDWKDPDDLWKPSKLIDEAHSLGLLVHGYIFQDDILNVCKDPYTELQAWFDKGVDGVFTEFTQSAYDYSMKLKSDNYRLLTK